MIMVKPTKKKLSGTIVVLSVLSFALVVVMFVYLSIIHKIHSAYNSESIVAGTTSSNSFTKEIRQLCQLIQYLETKMDSYLAYGKDPFLSMKIATKCTRRINV